MEILDAGLAGVRIGDAHFFRIVAVQELYVAHDLLRRARGWSRVGFSPSSILVPPLTPLLHEVRSIVARRRLLPPFRLDHNWRPLEAEFLAQPIHQVSLRGKVQLPRFVGESDERRRPYACLRQVADLRV